MMELVTTALWLRLEKGNRFLQPYDMVIIFLWRIS